MSLSTFLASCIELQDCLFSSFLFLHLFHFWVIQSFSSHSKGKRRSKGSTTRWIQKRTDDAIRGARQRLSCVRVFGAPLCWVLDRAWCVHEERRKEKRTESLRLFIGTVRITRMSFVTEKETKPFGPILYTQSLLCPFLLYISRLERRIWKDVRPLNGKRTYLFLSSFIVTRRGIAWSFVLSATLIRIRHLGKCQMITKKIINDTVFPGDNVGCLIADTAVNFTEKAMEDAECLIQTNPLVKSIGR